jgi:hypothetical protein
MLWLAAGGFVDRSGARVLLGIEVLRLRTGKRSRCFAQDDNR